MSIGNNTININNLKTAKKEHTDEAYRSLFLKTLKGKKENVFKQAWKPNLWMFNIVYNLIPKDMTEFYEI